MPDLADLTQRLIRAFPGRRDEALAVLNGAIGDRLSDAALGVPMRLFHGDELWPIDDPPIAMPDAKPTACLFVHGLMGSERAWRFGVGSGREDEAQPREEQAALDEAKVDAGEADSGEGEDGAGEGEQDGADEGEQDGADEGEEGAGERRRPRVDYGPALSRERDATALYVRYNTGLHISQNGRELAARLERLHEVWPFSDLVIVAHSMGGLVTRSALHYALEAGHAWVEQVTRVFLLGVPSRGAPLEFWAHVTAFTLEQIWNPWTRLAGRLINGRSAGIKDLRHGFVLDEDWQHYDLDRLAYPVPARAQAPSQARWYCAVGTLGMPDSVWAKAFGDGLVRSPSAQGKSIDPREPELLPPAEVVRFAKTGHLALMNDPAVLEQILAWWAI